MSDPVSALKGAKFDGFAKIREIGPLGMITLRAKPGTKALEKAVKSAFGLALPGQRKMVWEGPADSGKGIGWMSPDEYLVILPYAQVKAALAALETALVGEHFLAVDVSDARSIFRIEGDKADQVLRKLTPADMDRLEPGELRRTRTAQVAAAFWAQDGGYTLVAFRSVAGYVMGLLSHSAMAGSEIL